jgi:gliding motility-associated lipoprotein GldH
MNRLFYLFLFPAFLLTACASDSLVEAEQEIPGGLWAYGDTLDFKFDIADTSGRYNLYLTFEHADTFAFQNIYLRLYTRFPDGRRVSVVRSFDFFNSQGDGYGKCSGRRCELQTILQENAYFDRPGEYVLTLEQFTRRESLGGVARAGIRIDRN